MQSVLIIRSSAANAFADMRAIYSWRLWVFGWLGRMLAQVTFFTFLGRAVGDDERTAYLVVGNAVMTCVLECVQVVASTGWERISGTLILLAAAPARPVWVFFGRSLQWPVSGSATSLVALFALGPAFGITWRPHHILPVAALVVLTAFTTYCLGLFLAALVLNANGLRNIVSSAAYFVMMAVCGVQVPVDHWPLPVRTAAALLPLTHSLAAIRLVEADAGAFPIAAAAGKALLCGAVWLAAAYLVFESFMDRGRRTGNSDYF
ncbi:ABC transporter permease [Streptomyces sp. ME19-01-6]|uniref:ABC transporter permease n=1 Tax=Streptomyces sp. ME19-01-6 TaxID=3028686 RepID=UPI0029A196FC|nr:ABC transporter permease [Streptomyces sp. ME19-01-6]MDX3230402.1 ABC transporter permease [Streptomyces sp. ME19-01-6]